MDWTKMKLFIVFVTLAIMGACGAAETLKCESVKVSYWKDKNDSEYPYKTSYQCLLPDGSTPTVTPIVSKTRIPGCKKN